MTRQVRLAERFHDVWRFNMATPLSDLHQDAHGDHLGSSDFSAYSARSLEI